MQVWLIFSCNRPTAVNGGCQAHRSPYLHLSQCTHRFIADGQPENAEPAALAAPAEGGVAAVPPVCKLWLPETPKGPTEEVGRELGPPLGTTWQERVDGETPLVRHS